MAEPQADNIETYGAGWCRVIIDGTTYLLRRPLVGEFRRLRERLQIAEDLVREAQKAAGAALKTNTEAMAGVEADDELDDDEREARLEEFQLAARKISTELLEAADDARLDWWGQVFDELGVSTPKKPADWPSWILDPDGPSRVVSHWRSNPLARG